MPPVLPEEKFEKERRLRPRRNFPRHRRSPQRKYKRWEAKKMFTILLRERFKRGRMWRMKPNRKRLSPMPRMKSEL